MDVISKIERAETLPSVETIARLCKALDVSMAQFFTFDNPDANVAEVIEQIGYRLASKPLAFVKCVDRLITALEGDDR